MLKEDYTLPRDEDDRVMDALMDFIKLLKEREMNREPCDCPDCQDH